MAWSIKCCKAKFVIVSCALGISVLLLYGIDYEFAFEQMDKTVDIMKGYFVLQPFFSNRTSSNDEVKPNDPDQTTITITTNNTTTIVGTTPLPENPTNPIKQPTDSTTSTFDLSSPVASWHYSKISKQILKQESEIGLHKNDHGEGDNDNLNVYIDWDTSNEINGENVFIERKDWGGKSFEIYKDERGKEGENVFVRGVNPNVGMILEPIKGAIKINYP